MFPTDRNMTTEEKVLLAAPPAVAASEIQKQRAKAEAAGKPIPPLTPIQKYVLQRAGERP